MSDPLNANAGGAQSGGGAAPPAPKQYFTGVVKQVTEFSFSFYFVLIILHSVKRLPVASQVSFSLYWSPYAKTWLKK